MELKMEKGGREHSLEAVEVPLPGMAILQAE